MYSQKADVEICKRLLTATELQEIELEPKFEGSTIDEICWPLELRHQGFVSNGV